MSDEAEHRRRLDTRERGLALPETTWQAVEDRRAEWTDWPEPHLRLDSLNSVAENLETALRYVA